MVPGPASLTSSASLPREGRSRISKRLPAASLRRIRTAKVSRCPPRSPVLHGRACSQKSMRSIPCVVPAVAPRCGSSPSSPIPSRCAGSSFISSRPAWLPRAFRSQSADEPSPVPRQGTAPSSEAAPHPAQSARRPSQARRSPDGALPARPPFIPLGLPLLRMGTLPPQALLRRGKPSPGAYKTPYHSKVESVQRRKRSWKP